MLFLKKTFLSLVFQILEKGDLQVSDKERQVTNDSNFKELSNMIASMCVNPETKKPYSPSIIEKTLRDIGFNPKSSRSTKQNVNVYYLLVL